MVPQAHASTSAHVSFVSSRVLVSEQGPTQLPDHVPAAVSTAQTPPSAWHSWGDEVALPPWRCKHCKRVPPPLCSNAAVCSKAGGGVQGAAEKCACSAVRSATTSPHPSRRSGSGNAPVPLAGGGISPTFTVATQTCGRAVGYVPVPEREWDVYGEASSRNTFTLNRIC